MTVKGGRFECSQLFSLKLPLLLTQSMSCMCNSAITDSDMEPRRLKEGDIMKYKTGFLGSKWKTYHAVLFSDSKFCWYDEKGDRKPKGSILLKDVVPYICVGLMTDRMPVKRPSVPDGYSVHHLVGIGMDPRAETVHWILFSSDADIESWFNEITKTLPKPNPPPQPQQPTPQPQMGPGQPTGGYVPPAKYPDAPPPVQPTYPPAVPVGGGAPPPPYYNRGPGYGGGGGGGGGYGGGGGGYHGGGGGPTTVIIDRGGSAGYGGGSGLGAGLGGAALGFGSGMLMGSLLSYGMGSMWGGHSMIPSYGGGFGMGGGYYSDNDTTITNNYYNYPDPNAAGTAGDANDSQPAIQDVTDQDDVPDNDYAADNDVVDNGDMDQVRLAVSCDCCRGVDMLLCMLWAVCSGIMASALCPICHS
uniref:Pleckstrin homology domain containing protein n=1 Tax=Haemonchus contortus TaxID=6289 RepID=W6NC48_HAECO